MMASPGSSARTTMPWALFGLPKGQLPPVSSRTAVAPHAAGQGVLTLRSSRFVLVGRWTGVVHYDGSANDEG